MFSINFFCLNIINYSLYIQDVEIQKEHRKEEGNFNLDGSFSQIATLTTNELVVKI